MRVKFNERLLTEGPGAGYSIKWSVDNIYSTNILIDRFKNSEK